MFRKEQSTDLVNWKLLGSFENDADDANNGAVIRVWRLFKPALLKERCHGQRGRGLSLL